MSVSQIRDVNPSALAASAPPLDSYATVSEGWSEQEYRVDLGNPTLEGGYWAGDPGYVSFDEWPYTELCVILRGRVAVEDREGNRREYVAGQSFVIPQGFSGIWHTLESTEKIFVGIPSV